MKIENLERVNQINKRLTHIKNILKYLNCISIPNVNIFAPGFTYSANGEPLAYPGFSSEFKLSEGVKKALIDDLNDEYVALTVELNSLGVEFQILA